MVKKLLYGVIVHLSAKSVANIADGRQLNSKTPRSCVTPGRSVFEAIGPLQMAAAELGRAGN